ncbi:hypothetical protein ACG5V6_22045 [Streptomyces chitinivorans]|uniref:DUF5666 domain-containing protein n=1 Tax=Streptomyces chitinivorans TaxID=1257027 RepID=A0ABW7HY96_9ACTN|nr:hypothetical protein [Streptomyces chitinivorans]MDH2409722.1 hypothetical protein [Streptomyces chitinivorans]
MPRSVKCRRTRSSAALPLSVVSAVVVGAAALAGCGGDESPAPEASVSVGATQGAEDGYEFVYGDLAEAEFWNDVTTWTDRRIVLTAEVGEVIDAHAFTVARADPENRGDDTGDIRSLLVVSADTARVAEGDTVRVTGTVREDFVPEEVANGLDVDWDEGAFTDWERENYVAASSIDTSARLE